MACALSNGLGTISNLEKIACVESVPVESERNSGRAKESFGPRVKNGARAKRWKEGVGEGTNLNVIVHIVVSVYRLVTI